MFTMGIVRPGNRCLGRRWGLCSGERSQLSWTSPQQPASAFQASLVPSRGRTGDPGPGPFCPKLLCDSVIHIVHVHEISEISLRVY